MADDRPTNGIEPGFRITLPVIYGQLQEQTARISDLRADFRLLADRQETVSKENTKLRQDLVDTRKEWADALKLRDDAHKAEMDKLRNRFNGVLTAIGTGVIVGLPTLFTLLGSR